MGKKNERDREGGERRERGERGGEREEGSFGWFFW